MNCSILSKDTCMCFALRIIIVLTNSDYPNGGIIIFLHKIGLCRSLLFFLCKSINKV